MTAKPIEGPDGVANNITAMIGGLHIVQAQVLQGFYAGALENWRLNFPRIMEEVELALTVLAVEETEGG